MPGVAELKLPPLRSALTRSENVAYGELAGTAKIIGTVVMRPSGSRSFSQSSLTFGLTIGTATVSVPPM